MIDQNMSFGDFNQVEDEQDFSPLPRAIYPLRLTEPEIKPTQSGGQRVTYKLVVADGEHQGRTIFESFNVVNQNPKAVQIALKGIKSMFQSAGVDTSGQISWGLIQSSEGAVCHALVGLDKSNPDYNKVIRFVKPESQNQQIAQPQQAPNNQATPPNYQASNAPSQGVSNAAQNRPWQQR